MVIKIWKFQILFLWWCFGALLVSFLIFTAAQVQSDDEPISDHDEPEVPKPTPVSHQVADSTDEPESNQTSPAEIISESEVADLEAELDNLDVDDIDVDSDVDFDDFEDS